MLSCPDPFQFRNLPIVEPSNFRGAFQFRNLRITEPYIAEPPNSDTLPLRIVVPVQLRNLPIVEPSECGILKLRNLAQPLQADPFQFFNKTCLQRSWYWTGELKNPFARDSVQFSTGPDQWAEFSFVMDAGDPSHATMVVKQVTWNKSMEVDEDQEIAEEASSSLSIADDGS